MKKNNNSPDIIAPAMLVAANVIPRRITAVKTVPRIPASRVYKPRQQTFLSGHAVIDVKRTTPRYTTAIPKRTHKNAGVTVITAL